ncbi:MAG: ABC transporter permease [Opitutaceae bacterium]|jgi:putative ABC transport system permease protein|nr:ABC transporter permease [Opitutaceae bacterium]
MFAASLTRLRYLSLAFTNLRRHRLRALIGVAGIAFGVAAMLAILAVVHGAIGMFERILNTDSDYLVFERKVSDLFFSSVTPAQLAAVRARPEVAEAHAMLFGIVSADGHPVITCFGLEPSDPRLRRAQWRAGSADDFGVRPGEVFLGTRAAEFLEARPGDKVEIGRGEFVVGGIFRTENGFEDGGVFMALPDAQAFFHRENIASIVAVKLRERGLGPQFKAALEAEQPGVMALENREFSQNYNSFKILHVTAWAVGLCAFVLGGLGVANTMLLSVFGRIRELAVLRVCGFSARQVGALVMAESAALAALGLVAGLALGAAVLALLARLPDLQGYLSARLTPGVLVGIVATAFLTALGGALYPAWYAARIQPAEALRYE